MVEVTEAVSPGRTVGDKALLADTPALEEQSVLGEDESCQFPPQPPPASLPAPPPVPGKPVDARLVRTGSYGNTLVREDWACRGKSLRDTLQWTAPFFKSKKSEKEEENDNCIGGLRNPWKAVTRNQGLATAGSAVWDIFEEVVHAHPDAMTIADTLGTSSAEEPPEEAVHLYRSKI